MKLVVIGAGANAREMLDVVDARRAAGLDAPELLGFLVERPYGEAGAPAHGVTVLGDFDWLEGRRLDDVVGFCSVGSPALRRRLVGRAASYGLRFVSLVHPAVGASPRDRVGEGTLVQKGTVVTSGVAIGSFVHVYAGCLLSHDVAIGDFATLSPGVRLAGNVRVEEGATLGIGANVIQGRTVGAWSIAGAGATVIADVPADSTVVGVPARVVRRRAAGWHLHPGAREPF